MTSACAAVLAGIALSAPRSVEAQSAAPSPIVEHYKAYAAALLRNELALAETEAAAALTASVEKYGDGGRTAVLAMNLASVRLLQGKYEPAIDPARKALQLTEAAGAATGVNPQLARLALARAELRTGGRDAFERFEQALAPVAQVPELAAEAYPAALELGAFALETQRYAEAQMAWNTAVRLIRTEPDPDTLTLARAMLGEAAAGILARGQRDRSVSVPGSRLLGSGVKYSEFDDLLVQVIELTAPEARKPGADGALTPAQSVQAQAVAWRGVVKAKLISEDRELRPQRTPGDDAGEIGASRYTEPPCKTHVAADPKPDFPPASQVIGGVGSVVMKLRFDEAGLVRDATVAASVGGPNFARAVSDVASRWHLEKEDPVDSNCRLEREILLNVLYVYE